MTRIGEALLGVILAVALFGAFANEIFHAMGGMHP